MPDITHDLAQHVAAGLSERRMRLRYQVVTTGYWSVIFDRATGRGVSHQYDLQADAVHDAGMKNREWRAQERLARRVRALVAKEAGGE